MALNKIKVTSVKEAFIQEIESKILSGELKVGDKLPPARQLCTLMGVSLTIVNAGVSELASKGFLEVRPRHGTYVADYRLNGNTATFSEIMRYSGGKLNAHMLRSYCETRIALDQYVAKLVIERASNEQLAELGGYIEKLRYTSTPEEYSVAITDFYQKLYSLTDNTFMDLLYRSTVEPQKGIYAAYVRKNGTAAAFSLIEKAYVSIVARDEKNAVKHLIDAINSALEGDTSIIP